MFVYVTDDDNQYFRRFNGTKLTQSALKEVETNSIPNESDEAKQQFYKLIAKMVPVERTVCFIDKQGNEKNTQKEYIPSYVYSWQFDENAYNEWAETSGYEPVKTNQELQAENEALENEVDDLVGVVVDLQYQLDINNL